MQQFELDGWSAALERRSESRRDATHRGNASFTHTQADTHTRTHIRVNVMDGRVQTLSLNVESKTEKEEKKWR